MKIPFAALIAVPLFAAAAGLGPAGAQSLEDTLVKAYQNNPALKAERARLRATDEGVPQALSSWRPTVSMSGSYGQAWRDSTNSQAGKTSDVTNPATASLTVTQNLYRGGRTEAAVEQAERNVEADRARLGATEQTVLLGAATAYANVVRDQAVLELNINNERVLQRQLEATGDRFSVGELTRTDVSQAESRLALARATRISAEGSLTDSRANYENIVGERPPVLEAASPLTDLPATLEDAVSEARSGNFTVLAARFTESAARSNVDLITGELLPTLSVEGQVGTSHEATNRFSESDSASIIARVSVPLYASGSVSSRVREAKEVVAQRRDEYNQAIRDAIEGVTNAWQVLETAQAQIRAFAAAVSSTRIALDGVREEANVGSRTVLDVLDAEQEQLDAQVGLVRAQCDELVATFQLRQAIGDLTAARLGLPVQLYDVEKHYREVRNKWWGLDTPDEQ
ncbi:MAG: TolC family outer membrane protein [Rhodospirillaceae bacterium]